MKRTGQYLVIMLLLWVTGNAQNKGDPVRIAVLPFEDLLGSSNPNTAAFMQLLLSELTRQEKLSARIAKPDKPTPIIDRETGLALAKKQEASLLVMGRIIEATSSQGNSGLPIPTLGRVNSTSVTASVRVEMEVVSVSTGKTLGRIQAEGRKTVRSNQTWLNGRLGSINVGGNTTNSSPMGQAMNECAEKLIKQLVEISRKD